MATASVTTCTSALGSSGTLSISFGTINTREWTPDFPKAAKQGERQFRRSCQVNMSPLGQNRLPTRARGRTNQQDRKPTTGRNRLPIQLKFNWGILTVIPSLSNGGEPRPGSIGALARLQHITRISLREVGASPVPDFPLSLPLLSPWVRGDGVGYPLSNLRPLLLNRPTPPGSLARRGHLAWPVDLGGPNPLGPRFR